nr:MAG TPA: INTERNALIN B BINDING, LEUCINE RICH REPEAT.2A [Caudoviricetes sp.]
MARNGYKLLGWSANNTATTAGYDPDGWVTVGNSTVQRYYAVWQKSEATITLYGNGGLWGGNLQYRSFKKEVGDVINLADYGPNGTPPLGRAYYSLVGWSTSSTGTAAWGVNGTITVGATDASYYAIWEPHIELFYWDGGTGSTDSSIIAKGLPVTNLTASRWNRFKKKINEIT